MLGLRLVDVDPQDMTHPIILAITGASGAVYAVRLLELMLRAGRTVHVTLSPSGAAVLRQELGLRIDLAKFRPGMLLTSEADPPGEILAGGKLFYYHYQDFFAPMASGSFLTSGMVVCPCSGGTLSAIAHAASENLIHRAADVHLKERRKLVVVPRETPLSSIQLDNMKRLAEAGAVVLPAMPGWYHGAKSLQDLIDFVVARILDQLGIEHELMKRWGTP
jgi:4-hydroxy-3-polyprenylbenzoate decarboxylase